MTLTMQGRYRFQEFEIDLAHRSLQREGHTIALDATSFDLLAFLVLHPQRVITEDELTEALWPELDDLETDLHEHISQLRKALAGVLPGERLLATIPGYGYQFTSPVMETSVLEAPETGRSSEDRFDNELNLEEDADEPPEPAQHFAETLEGARRKRGAKQDDDAEDEDSQARAAKRGSRGGFRLTASWWVAILTGIVTLLVFGVLWSWRTLHRPTAEPLRIVLADFTNTAGNPQFDLSLKTALALDLEQSPFLTVVSQAAAAQALRELKADPDKPLFPELTRQLCAQVHGNVYVTGAVRPLGNHFLATIKAYHCSDGNSLAESRGIADSPDAVVAVLDKVAVDLRKQLGESPQSAATFSKPLFADRPASLDALKAYSDASRSEMQGSLEQALTLLQHAVEIDPQFALAFARLGSVYSQLGQRDQSIAALTRAFQLRDSLSEPNRLEVIASYNDSVTGDLQASLRNYKDWSQEYPRNPTPLVALAEREIQIGKIALAIEPAQRALVLNPSDALNYAVLARAQLSLGQVDAAAKTCQLASSSHLDSEPIHGFLLQIAFLRLDQPGIDAQLAWAREAGRDSSALPYMQLQQGLMNFALGKAKAGQDEFTNAAAAFAAFGENERAGRILGAMPRIEAELGLTEAAHAQLVKLTNLNDAALNESSDIPVAWAHTGETSRAAALLKSELDAHPANTLWQEDFAPQVKAAIAMNQQHFAEAVDDLKPALPFDMRSFEAPAMRGRAYLAAKQPALAEAEFHKILDHTGIEPLSHNYPLARLGLARALAQEGKIADAGYVYKLVLQIWKDADSDLPRLKEAKAEYARLTGEPVKAKPAALVRPGSKQPASKTPAKRR
ncbi:MAG TPA: winged helix-turn-helix domain-containing protein [Acidobacteriaceae bacterium]|jgi:DNA-binding winged helix-turn-helix (wHTH) protein/Tfp pilus assembly protein PilF|nr:winged helix-turn-helix domain-containing protein [Acidobacteriaceae bacterium]